MGRPIATSSTAKQLDRNKLVGTCLCKAAGMPTNLSRTVTVELHCSRTFEMLAPIVALRQGQPTENNPTDYKVRMVGVAPQLTQ